MGRTVKKTHILYPETGMHRSANATCYRCGVMLKARRMRWLKHREKNTCAALCASCSSAHQATFAEPLWAAVQIQFGKVAYGS